MFKRIKKTEDHFMKYLIKNNILAQQHYIPIYKFKIYKETSNYLPESEKYFKNSVSIPIFINLSNNDQNKIIKNYFK
tara:strand:- start:558 stop:788 length:231 start_codon:yes stop_codon:yes gene_type:complete